MYNFIYPGYKANSLRCAPCTVPPKPPFLRESWSSLFDWESHHGPHMIHMRSHSVSLQCLGHTQYLLQQDIVFQVSSLSLSSSLSRIFARPHHLVLGISSSLLIDISTRSILSSHLLHNCPHIGLRCHGCVVSPFLKRRILRAAHIMATQVQENFFFWGGGGGNAPPHIMSFQLVVVPRHTKQTLLKQLTVSQTSLISKCVPFPHTLFLLLLCHLPTTSMSLHRAILAAVMLDRRIIKASFYEGTFSNRWLWTGILLN